MNTLVFTASSKFPCLWCGRLDFMGLGMSQLLLSERLKFEREDAVILI